MEKAKHNLDGMRNILNMYRVLEKPESSQEHIVKDAIRKAWKEATSSKEAMTAFLAIGFRTGAVARQHKQLSETFTPQGQGHRPAWHWFNEVLREVDPKGKITNSELFFESQIIYLGWSDFLEYFNETDRKTGALKRTWDNLSYAIDLKAEYTAKRILTTPAEDMEHQLIAKAIPNPQARSKRTRTYIKTESGKVRQKNSKDSSLEIVDVKKVSVKEHTKLKLRIQYEFLNKLSEYMGWTVEQHDNFKIYRGIIDYKKKYRVFHASNLFSKNGGKAFRGLNSKQFLNLYDSMTAGDVAIVNNHIYTFENDERVPNPKWILSNGEHPVTLIEEYWKEKEKAVKELQAVTRNTRSVMGEDEYQKLKKKAKINFGGKTKLMEEVWAAKLNYSSKKDPQVAATLESLILQLDLPDRQVMPVIDVSYSMHSHRKFKVKNQWVSVSALDYSIMMLSLYLYRTKTPFFMTFSNTATIHLDTERNAITQGKIQNSLFSSSASEGTTTYEKGFLRDSFVETLRCVEGIINNQDHGGTHISEIANALEVWAYSPQNESEKRMRAEQLTSIKMLLVFSDGDFNNSYSNKQSIKEVIRKMELLGMSPLILAWNCNGSELKQETGYEDVREYISVSSTNPNIFRSLLDFEPGEAPDLMLPVHKLATASEFKYLRKLSEEWYN